MDLVFDGKALTTKIQNNTDRSLTLTSTIQALTFDGVDAMTPIVGPDVTVPAGARSQGLVVELPTIADGYYRVTSTATASTPAGMEQGGAQVFIHVQSGVAREIEWAEWDDKTGDGPVVPG
ncbi:hypothetical protein [Nannocystis punicea]|uniref:Uncharacterized protein n=1 Tax=Nannocystis punicea TaxID=2995304 RepID=A0ABY7H5E3_9BACT|nr:hypothetical protein [Nannocystis poenicansa]WAS94501.1 hypothetical protein O0S08_50940 [Nannocystis poenicansa]